MPASLVPFVFVCDPMGVAPTLPKGGSWVDIAVVTLETLVGIAGLGFAFQGRLLRKSTVLETALFFAPGILLVFPERIAAILGLAGLPLAYPHAIAFVLAAIGVLMQWMWSEPAQAPDVLILSLDHHKGAQPNAARPKHPRRRHRRRIGFGSCHGQGAGG
jgi:hypothetical protein